MKTNKPQNLPALLACALLLTISLLGVASPAWSDYRQMSNEMAQFHAFMRKHPGVSSDLQANPQLVNNRNYLDKHDEVREFLRHHPAVRTRDRSESKTRVRTVLYRRPPCIRRQSPRTSMGLPVWRTSR